MYLISYEASYLYSLSPFILWKTVTYLKWQNSCKHYEPPQDNLQVDVKVIIHVCIHIPHTFSGFNLVNDLYLRTASYMQPAIIRACI